MDSAGNAGEVDAESCTERIQAVLLRAEYHARGQRAARDAGKAKFEPDWAAVVKSVRDDASGAEKARDEAAQADVARCNVRLFAWPERCSHAHDAAAAPTNHSARQQACSHRYPLTFLPVYICTTLARG